MTSSAHDADLKGSNFRHTIHPQSFIAVAFIFSELDGGGLWAPPPVQKIEKKPGLDRVKIAYIQRPQKSWQTDKPIENASASCM